MKHTKITAKIVAHSKRENTGEELITYELIFPRIILSEINVYKMLSKNTSSNRAVRFESALKVVKETPFIPIAFQESHKGMQGDKYIEDEKTLKDIKDIWLSSRDNAINQAKLLHNEKVTKQLCNRLLEPFMWVKQLITGTRESFEHMFNQRCPDYNGFKSWKELCNADINYTLKTPYIDRLKVNKGKAEIHFMYLAEKMYDELRESKPEILKEGEYHIPYKKEILKEYSPNTTQDIITISVAKTARVSYTNFQDETLTAIKANNIFHHCLNNGHWSVFEHIGKVMSINEYISNFKGHIGNLNDHEALGWNKNFKGFIQLRSEYENITTSSGYM